jgi:hypothetical protein
MLSFILQQIINLKVPHKSGSKKLRTKKPDFDSGFYSFIGIIILFLAKYIPII